MRPLTTVTSHEQYNICNICKNLIFNIIKLKDFGQQSVGPPEVFVKYKINISQIEISTCV